jgi:hypothetical protein
MNISSITSPSTSLPPGTTMDTYIAAKRYLDSIRPKYTIAEIDAMLRKIEEEELKGPTYIVAIRLMSRKQLISHCQAIEKRYLENFTPYVLKRTKWHRLRIPRVAHEYELPKNWKSIVRHADYLQKQGILPVS